MTKLYNQKKQTPLRKILRKNMPKAEILLWGKLKNKQLLGFKFRRQFSVGRYVVDFYCPQLRLAIEIDGETHLSKDAKSYDQERQKIIEKFDIKFLRFWNTDIYNNIDGVLERIIENLNKLNNLNP
ncbi:MAG: endonuclease domain-containing protein [Patescibacteria group bacterium]|jgi:very-short-patch-repair endonuclease